MSTTSSNITHLPHTPHTAHPLPLREQAFTLHCQGLRSPAISAELGVPERTIRAWIAADLDELKDDLRLSRKEQLLLAVERQHQITSTAWQQFEREAAARDAILDATLDILLTVNDSTASANTPARALHFHLPASTPAPRYLSLILQANKETNRLLGLHTLARLQLLTSDAPDIPVTDPIPFADITTPAESATGIAAKMATAPGGLAASFQPTNDHHTIPSPSRDIAADHSAIPAESATAPAGPAPSSAFRPTAPAPAVYCRDTDSSLPAESATAIAASHNPAKTATENTSS